VSEEGGCETAGKKLQAASLKQGNSRERIMSYEFSATGYWLLANSREGILNYELNSLIEGSRCKISSSKQ
jgi:hypothetical protein